MDADPVTYYTGSHMRLEWCNQHACGPNQNVNCQVIIQAACDDTMPGLRDGYPTGDLADVGGGETTGQYYARQFVYNNADGTARIPEPNGIPAEVLPENQDSPEYQQAVDDFYNANTDTPAGLAGLEYGMHENYTWYSDFCDNRERNFGLLHLDQQLNGNDARRTRQTTNGARSGLECPEEREYYPYWNPTMWRDIAVLTSNVAHCEFYQARSQNVESRWYCDCDEECRNSAEPHRGVAPIQEGSCVRAGGSWVEFPSWDMLPPDCLAHPWGADNHLGFAFRVDESDESVLEERAPQNAYYDMIVPEWMEGHTCTIRMRYNITTGDFPGFSYLSPDGEFLDSTYDCDPNTEDEGGQAEGETRPYCQNILTTETVPLYNDPYIRVWDDEPELSIALNTDQTARCFEDRAYVFRVSERPDEIADGATIWNLGVRGRRGNIVQTFPATEYIFCPDRMEVQPGDWVSFTAHSSWFNDPNTAGNGNNYMDASNLVIMNSAMENFPAHPSEQNFVSDEMARRLAHPPFNTPADGEYSSCGPGFECCIDYYTYEVEQDNNEDYDQQIFNCGKLNHAPPVFHVDFQIEATSGQEYFFVSTRNNDFSNRSQKGSIYVASPLSAGAIAGIVIASVAVAGAGVGFGIYKFKNRGASMASAV